MALINTQEAKEKGNAAFKSGDYPTAIGHYTTAILANRSEPTFPSNRAAAYLKLGKYGDAARDCSTVLALSPSNVKALFRRGQANVGLDKLLDAQNDYQEASRLDPTNESIRLEMSALEKLIQNERLRQHAKTGTTIPLGNPAISSGEVPKKRRRIPISIIEPVNTTSATPKTSLAVEPKATSSSQVPDLLEPISVRPFNSPQATSTASCPVAPITPIHHPMVRTSQDVEQARESLGPSRSAGGIFRHSGKHTIFGVREPGSALSSSSVPAPKARASASQLVTSGSMPPTLFDFVRAWDSLSSAEERWPMISSVPPSGLPAMFQMSLEPSLLVSLFDTIRTILDHNRGDANIIRQAEEYMKALASVPRFSTVWLFLDKTEKGYAKDVWRMLGVDNPGTIWAV